MKNMKHIFKQVDDVVSKFDFIAVDVARCINDGEFGGLDLSNSRLFGARFGKSSPRTVTKSDEEADETLQNIFPEIHKHIRAVSDAVGKIKQEVVKHIEADNEIADLDNEEGETTYFSIYLYQLRTNAARAIEAGADELDKAIELLAEALDEAETAYYQAQAHDVRGMQEAREAVVVAN